jgi:hypothetical protein
MHPRCERIINLQVALGILPDFDDVLADRFAAEQLIGLVESEREDGFGHCYLGR